MGRDVGRCAGEGRRAGRDWGTQENSIHPTAVLGPGVSLGSGNTIGPGVILLGPLHLGNDENGSAPTPSSAARQRSRASTTVPPGTASWSGPG